MNIGENNIMLDLETMGNGSNAAITAIGAVRFNTIGVTDEFYKIIDLQSSVNAGLEMDASTVLWWLKQDDNARKQFEDENISLASALQVLSLWLGREAKVWGNGSSFDNVILANAYRAIGVKQPWNYWDDRCYRTIKNMFPHIKLARTGIKHNALDDAISQADHLISIVKSIA